MEILEATPGVLHLITPSWGTSPAAQRPVFALLTGTIILAGLAVVTLLAPMAPKREYFFLLVAGLPAGAVIAVYVVSVPRWNRWAFQHVKRNQEKSVELQVLEVRPTRASRTTELLVSAEGEQLILTVRDPHRELVAALRLAGRLAGPAV